MTHGKISCTKILVRCFLCKKLGPSDINFSKLKLNNAGRYIVFILSVCLSIRTETEKTIDVIYNEYEP